MGMVLINDKKDDLIDKERAYLNACQMRFFVNDYVPVGTSALANFTECVDGGYLPHSPAFAPAFVNGAGQGQLQSGWHLFMLENTVNYTIFGYYLVDPADANKVVLAERFAVPVVIAEPEAFLVRYNKLMDTL